MKQWKRKDFINMIEKNGYYYHHDSGGHSIYKNKEGKHISIPLELKSVIALRIIKENNLKE